MFKLSSAEGIHQLNPISWNMSELFSLCCPLLVTKCSSRYLDELHLSIGAPFLAELGQNRHSSNSLKAELNPNNSTIVLRWAHEIRVKTATFQTIFRWSLWKQNLLLWTSFYTSAEHLQKPSGQRGHNRSPCARQSLRHHVHLSWFTNPGKNEARCELCPKHLQQSGHAVPWTSGICEFLHSDRSQHCSSCFGLYWKSGIRSSSSPVTDTGPNTHTRTRTRTPKVSNWQKDKMEERNRRVLNKKVQIKNPAFLEEVEVVWSVEVSVLDDGASTETN